MKSEFEPKVFGLWAKIIQHGRANCFQRVHGNNLNSLIFFVKFEFVTIGKSWDKKATD